MGGAAFAQKAFQRDDLADAAIKLEAQIRTESGQVTAPAAALRRDADAAFQRNDFRNGLQILGQHHGGGAGGQRQLAAHRADRAADPPRQRARAHDAARARRDRRLYRLSAHQVAGRGGRRPADRVAQLCRPPALASGARCDAALARPARGRRRAAAIRAHARGPRLPPARLLGRCRRRVAARLLPVLGGSAGPAHRSLAVRRGLRPGPSGADGRHGASSASKASSTASATPSRCAPAFRRRCARRSPSRPSSTSMCATASRWCASPAAPMCCRASASAASRWSA